MSFVKSYARVSLIIALIMALYSILGLQLPQTGTPLEAVMTMIQSIWMIFSLLSLLFFPAYKAPLAAPLTFIVFGLTSLILTFAFAMAFASVHSAPWVMWAKHTRAPIYYLTLGMAIVFAVLNVQLLRLKPAPEGTAGAEDR